MRRTYEQSYPTIRSMLGGAAASGCASDETRPYFVFRDTHPDLFGIIV